MEPISNSRSAGVSSTEPSTRERIDQIRMGAGSSPEEMLALASLDVEEAADRSQQTRRLDRQASGQQRRGSIAKRRKAAKLQLGGQLVQSAGAIASSATSVLGGSRGDETAQANTKALADAGTALHDATGALLANLGSQAEQDAAMMDLHADEAQQRSSDSGEHADALDQHQSKLMQATESISRLRHDAMMASIRG